MVRKIKNFAKKNLFFWAIMMGFISTFILFIVGLFLYDHENSSYYQDNTSFSEFIKMIFYFLVLHLFFLLFSLTKTTGILFRIINTILFFIVFCISYIYSFENMEYLNQKINFIPVIEWTNSGYEPPEKDLSSIF